MNEHPEVMNMTDKNESREIDFSLSVNDESEANRIVRDRTTEICDVYLEEAKSIIKTMSLPTMAIDVDCEPGIATIVFSTEADKTTFDKLLHALMCSYDEEYQNQDDEYQRQQEREWGDKSIADDIEDLNRLLLSEPNGDSMGVSVKDLRDTVTDQSNEIAVLRERIEVLESYLDKSAITAITSFMQALASQLDDAGIIDVEAINKVLYVQSH